MRQGNTEADGFFHRLKFSRWYLGGSDRARAGRSKSVRTGAGLLPSSNVFLTTKIAVVLTTISELFFAGFAPVRETQMPHLEKDRHTDCWIFSAT